MVFMTMSASSKHSEFLLFFRVNLFILTKLTKFGAQRDRFRIKLENVLSFGATRFFH